MLGQLSTTYPPFSSPKSGMDRCIRSDCEIKFYFYVALRQQLSHSKIVVFIENKRHYVKLRRCIRRISKQSRR